MRPLVKAAMEGRPKDSRLRVAVRDLMGRNAQFVRLLACAVHTAVRRPGVRLSRRATLCAWRTERPVNVAHFPCARVLTAGEALWHWRREGRPGRRPAAALPGPSRGEGPRA